MPFCPECKYEFVEGVKQCADCLMDLVSELPTEDQPQGESKWVPLHSLPGPVYAEMVKAALQEHGIPCLIRKDFLSSAYGTQGTSSGGLESYVFVPEEHWEKSEAVLNQMLNHI